MAALLFDRDWSIRLCLKSYCLSFFYVPRSTVDSRGKGRVGRGGDEREKSLRYPNLRLSFFLPSFLSCVFEARPGTCIRTRLLLTGVVLIIADTHTQHSKENTYAMRGTLPPSYFGAATCTQLDPEECISGPQGLARASPSRARRYVSAFFFFLSFFSLCVCV